MIIDGKQWHYLVVKKFSALFKEIISNHIGDFCCLNCLHSFRTENKLKKHENVCTNHDYCYTEMDWVQLPQGWSHFKETVYFLPLSSQKFLVLILPTTKG